MVPTLTATNLLASEQSPAPTRYGISDRARSSVSDRVSESTLSCGGDLASGDSGEGAAPSAEGSLRLVLVRHAGEPAQTPA